jgi:hypothetical protein
MTQALIAMIQYLRVATEEIRLSWVMLPPAITLTPLASIIWSEWRITDVGFFWLDADANKYGLEPVFITNKHTCF